MNMLFAERLKSARMMNGYSLQDLSDKLGTKITRQALHKYETGIVIPDSEMMGYLCDALQVRQDYFSRKIEVELGEINYRKFNSLPQKEQISIVEKTKEVLSRYMELEDILEMQNTFINPIQHKTISTIEDVEQATIILRKEWGLDDSPISSVIEFLEGINIKVIEINSIDDFDGLQTNVLPHNSPIIVLNKLHLKSKDRIRFTALHELGHVLMILDSKLTEHEKERLCHAFAGAMLISKEAAIKEFGIKRQKISVQELGIVKKQYGISLQALILRLFNVNIISKYYKDFLYNFMLQMGWKTDEPYIYEGYEESSRFERLLYRALSEEVISINKAASLQNMSVAEFRTKNLMV